MSTAITDPGDRLLTPGEVGTLFRVGPEGLCGHEECPKHRKAYGYCSLHGAQFKRTGRTWDTITPAELTERWPASNYLPVPNTSPSFAGRVFSRVEVTASCWLWTGTLDAHGYGILGRGVRGMGNVAAHRAVWELLVGPIPPDMHFDHLCRNHPCVSPEHGEIVTAAENKRRGFSIARLHTHRTECFYGHPLDGMTGSRGSSRVHRYCKTCARTRTAERNAKCWERAA